MILPCPIKNLKIKQILKDDKGFTFIEILVVISLMFVLLGFAVLSVRDHYKKQKVEQAAGILESNLKLVKQKALSNSRPSGQAGELIAYEVRLGSNNAYSVWALFDTNDDGSYDADLRTNSFILSEDTNVTFTVGTGNIIFDTLAQSTSGLSSLTVTNADSYTCEVVIDPNTVDIKLEPCT